MNRNNLSSSNISLPSMIFLALSSTVVNLNNKEHTPTVVYPQYMNVNHNYPAFPTQTVSNIVASTSAAKFSDIEQYELIKALGELLSAKSKDMDPEIAKVVNENFWDLI